MTGFNGTVLKTIDGGENWDIQNTGIGNSLVSVFFIDDTTAMPLEVLASL